MMIFNAFFFTLAASSLALPVLADEAIDLTVAVFHRACMWPEYDFSSRPLVPPLPKISGEQVPESRALRSSPPGTSLAAAWHIFDQSEAPIDVVALVYLRTDRDGKKLGGCELIVPSTLGGDEFATALARYFSPNFGPVAVKEFDTGLSLAWEATVASQPYQIEISIPKSQDGISFIASSERRIP